jgi:hypothetical protein
MPAKIYAQAVNQNSKRKSSDHFGRPECFGNGEKPEIVEGD